MADLKRYTAQVPLGEGCLVSIEGPEHNHIANVMRHQKGDKVILLNGDGYDYTAEIIAITKKRAHPHQAGHALRSAQGRRR
jgi:16S rRNA U1498 N3-methylase RsmE